MLKQNESKRSDEYRTCCLVLEAWDCLALAPRNRDGRWVGISTAAMPKLSQLSGVDASQ